jgi:hypothetical protein
MQWHRWPSILALALAGCAGNPPRPGVDKHPVPPVPTPKPPVIVTPGNLSLNVGKITAVNPGARFVVITYALGNLPGAGRRLGVYRNGLKVGEIKITGPARDNNTVADIVAGECQNGDEVKEP